MSVPLRCDCGRFVSVNQTYADGTPMTAEEGTYVALCDRCASRSGLPTRSPGSPLDPVLCDQSHTHNPSRP